jgi:hypothetical protein
MRAEGSVAGASAASRPLLLGDTMAIGALALAARLAVVLWALDRFPPATDGVYYHQIAERIGAGFGYTWRWPDGVVTYAAHYPVGYPAALGALYAGFGAKPAIAMVFNAVLGALAAIAVHRLAARAASRRQAYWAGGFVALHPGLVLYTPAIMTEGVTAALIACAAALSAWARGGHDLAPLRGRTLLRLVGLGAILGLSTLVRPQSLVLSPLFALLAVLGGAPEEPARAAIGTGIEAKPSMWKRGLAAMGVVTAVTLLVCAPWTARNCVRMKRCALVSVNGGWNLLIGADEAATGAWASIKVPAACRDVYDEAEKDICFGREARRFITREPGTWLGLVPSKLGATFDYAGAPGSYLHASNPAAFGEEAKAALGVVETLFERLALLLALSVVGRKAGEQERPALRRTRLGVAVVGALFVCTTHAWVGYVAFGVAGLLRGHSLARGPILVRAAAIVVLATAAVHAVFFGAGRYSLVVFPLLTGVSALAFRRGLPPDRAGDASVL